MFDGINYSSVPAPHMRDGVERYIEHGILPGSFQTAVMENNLTGAVGQADDINLGLLVEWVRWWWDEAPSDCWGSPERVVAWVAKGGLAGIAQVTGEAR